MRKGNICCVLYGGHVPLILRENDGYYLFVGEAYIHGFMRGEAMSMSQNKDLEEQEFELR
jgi:hypothetical protein